MSLRLSLALLLIAPIAARAQPPAKPTETEALRKELEALKQKVADLERRLHAVQAKAEAALKKSEPGSALPPFSTPPWPSPMTWPTYHYGSPFGWPGTPGVCTPFSTYPGFFSPFPWHGGPLPHTFSGLSGFPDESKKREEETRRLRFAFAVGEARRAHQAGDAELARKALERIPEAERGPGWSSFRDLFTAKGPERIPVMPREVPGERP